MKTSAVDRAEMLANGCANNWSFWNSYFFASTVVNTLGYGDVFPATNSGKVLTSTLSGLLIFNPPRTKTGCKIPVFTRNLDFLHFLRDDWSALIFLYD